MNLTRKSAPTEQDSEQLPSGWAGSPFDDGQMSQLIEPSRAAIASFWFGCFGLSLIAIGVTFCAKVVCARINFGLVEYAFQWDLRSQTIPRYWTHELSVTDSFLPCMVLLALIPILYWRGGLAQRFSISTAIAIIAMNAVSDPIDYFSEGDGRFTRVREILLFLFMIPVLFWFAPLRTRSLRFIVAFCLIALAFCTSIFLMGRVPRSLHVHSWTALYLTGFGLALFSRNWGDIALLEATANAENLERTSSKTLLELMAISSICLIVTLFWTREIDRNLLIAVGTSIATGAFTAIAGIANVQVGLGGKRFGWKRVGLMWFLFGVVYCCCVALRMTVASDAVGRFPVSLAFFSLLWGLVAIVFFVIQLNLCVFWLRLCGWRTFKPGCP